jgi:hypothetical protein
MDRIRIELQRREFGHSAAYDALADDLHEQGWKMVIVEPIPGGAEVEYSVAVRLSEHVTDEVLGAILASIIGRLRRAHERSNGELRLAVIYGPDGEQLSVVELDEEVTPLPDE